MDKIAKYSKLQILLNQLNDNRRKLKNILNDIKNDYKDIDENINVSASDIDSLLDENKWEFNKKWEDIAKLYDTSVYNVFNIWVNSKYPYQNSKYKSNELDPIKNESNKETNFVENKEEIKVINQKNNEIKDELMSDGTKNKFNRRNHNVKDENINDKDYIRDEEEEINKKNVKIDIKLIQDMIQNKMDWIQIGKSLSMKPIEVYKEYKRLTMSKETNKWSFLQDEKLLDAVEIYGKGNWIEISRLVGKKPQQCLHRYRKINFKKGRWTQSEDKKILEGVKKFGFKWIQISEILGNRSDSQCRERYYNVLDPNINKEKFKTEELNIISDLYKKYGPKWSTIAKSIPGRTDSQIRRAYFRFLDQKK